MNVFMAMLAGLGFGILLTIAAMVWYIERSESILLVDRWWLENSERWEWLRQYERGEDRTGE